MMTSGGFSEFFRRNRGLVSALAVVYGATIFLVLSKISLGPSFEEVRDHFFTYQNLRLFLTGGTALLFFVLVYRFMRFYLNPDEAAGANTDAKGFRFERSQSITENVLGELDHRIGRILSRLEKGTAERNFGPPPPEIFQDVEEKLKFKERIVHDVVKEISDKVDKEIVARLSSDSQYKQAGTYQERTRERLYQVVQGLERRANLNLAVGATIGGSGIGVLIYLLYVAPPVIPGTLDHTVLVVQYVSRISIVILIETFAFFFLKLYSQTLGELRHTHNEITNIEMKASGLAVAIAASDKKSLTLAIKNAVETERNFVLDKGKTTVDLERYRSEEASSIRTTNMLRELLFPMRNRLDGKTERPPGN